MQSNPEIPWEAWFGVGGGLLILIGVLALYLTLQVWSLVWVARDATARGKEAFLVVILVFFTWPIGLLVWVVARPDIKLAPPWYPMQPPPPLPRD